MTPEDYLWYSKAVLFTTTVFTTIGIFIRWKSEARARYPLAYMSLLLTFICITDIYLSMRGTYHPLMIKSGSSFGILFFGLIITAFFYLYAIEIFYPQKATTKLLFLLNIPLLFCTLGYIILVIAGGSPLQNYNAKEFLNHSWISPFAILWLVTFIILVFYALFVNVRTLKWTLIHLQNMKKYFSMAESFRYYCLIVTYLIFSLTILLGSGVFLSRMNIRNEASCFLCFAFLLILIYVISLFQTKGCPNKQSPPKNDNKNREQHDTTDETPLIRMTDRILSEKITNLMECEQLYRTRNLTTTVVAQRLGISRKKLYLFIREHYHSTFSDYINGYRIQHAEKLMSDKENIDLSIPQILEMSGFNSVKTFNKFFKAKHSVTPMKYRNSIDF